MAHCSLLSISIHNLSEMVRFSHLFYSVSLPKPRERLSACLFPFHHQVPMLYISPQLASCGAMHAESLQESSLMALTLSIVIAIPTNPARCLGCSQYKMPLYG